MENYKKNLKLLENNHVYSTEMEHDACGVGVIASTEGKKSRQIVEYAIIRLISSCTRATIPIKNAVSKPSMRIISNTYSERSYNGDNLATIKMPAVTIVAA